MTASALHPIEHDEFGDGYPVQGALLHPKNGDTWHYHLSWVRSLRMQIAHTIGSPLSLRVREYSFEDRRLGTMFGTYTGRTVNEAAVRCLVHSSATADVLYTTVQGTPVSSFDRDRLKRAAKRLGLLHRLQRQCTDCGAKLPFGATSNAACSCTGPVGPTDEDLCQAQRAPRGYR